MSHAPPSSPSQLLEPKPSHNGADSERPAFEPSCRAGDPANQERLRPAMCTAHFDVQCPASLPDAARKKMLEHMRNAIVKYDPKHEHRKWCEPMNKVPPSLKPKVLAQWVRKNLFMGGRKELVSLKASADLAAEDLYYYEWDPITQRWYLVCEHTLGLTESKGLPGSPAKIDFDPDYPDGSASRCW